MLYSILLSIITFLIFILMIFTMLGKIKIQNIFITYFSLILLPFFLIYYPIVFFDSLALSNYSYIPLSLLGVELLVLFFFIIVKLNIYPVENKSENMHYKFSILNNSLRLINSAIFCSLFYIIPIIILSILATYLGIDTLSSIMESIILPLSFVIAIPTSISSFAYIAISIILVITILAFSINGAIRLACASLKCRKTIAFDLILLFIPICNIVCLFYLKTVAKKELMYINGYHNI